MCLADPWLEMLQRYSLLCVSLLVYIRLVEKPTAVPAATGRRMEAAALSKMNEGRVRDGIYVVMMGRSSIVEDNEETKT